MQTIGGVMFFLGLTSLISGFGVNSKYGTLIQLLGISLVVIGITVMVAFV